MNRLENEKEYLLWKEFCRKHGILIPCQVEVAELFVDGTHFVVTFEDLIDLHINPLRGEVIDFLMPYGKYRMTESTYEGDAPNVSKITYKTYESRVRYSPDRRPTQFVNAQ